MATNMAPHNLVEVVQALRHLITHPDADLDDLMRFVPGPDLPTGGKIVGLDGIREAYETGRGSFRMRATARIETVGAAQGHRGHRAALRRRPGEGHRADQGAGPGQEAARASPTSRTSPTGERHPAGHRGQERLRPRGDPRAALPADPDGGVLRHQQRRLVDGQPRTLGLKELLEVFLEHRYDVVRRRSRTAAQGPSGCTWSTAC